MKTMPRPRLVEAFQTPACFTMDEAVAVTGEDREATWKQVKYLLDRGYVERVRRGLYVLVPERAGSDSPDPLVVASKVVEPYLFSYHTALELNGVAESAFFHSVYVAAPTRFTPFTWNRQAFHPVAIDMEVLDAGRSTTKRSGGTLHVACRELALIQCADRLEYAGGLPEVLASVSGFPYVDWGRLLDLLAIYGKTVLYRKVGYLVAANADSWRLPDAVRRELRAKLGTGTTYFGVKPNRGGRSEPDWQVIVPAHAPAVSGSA